AHAAGLLLENAAQLRHKAVVQGLVYEQALHAEAHLAAIEEAADVGVFGGSIDVGVLAHDHRVAAAELERDAFDLPAGNLHDVAAHLGRAGEGDAPHLRVSEQLLADLAAWACHDADRTRGQLLL